MSEAAENVEIVRAAYRAWGERGIEGLLEVMHAEVEWHPPPSSPEPGPHRGRDEVLRAVDSYLESFAEFRPEPDQILPGERQDQVLVLGTLIVRGRDSGAEFTTPVGHLLTIRDRKVIRFEVFTDRDKAIAAAGLDSAG